MKNEIKIPTGAMQFTDKSATVKGSLSMLAYGGGVIKAHWFWQDLIINLAGMSFPREVIPILENHDTAKKVGFVRRSQIQKNGNLKVISGVILDTESGQEFSRLSKTGYPWQASLHAKPSVIEKIPEGEKVSLNGGSFEGPLTIWDACELREISICTLGWDSSTKAEAFATDIHSLSVEMKGFDADDLLAEEIFMLTQNKREIPQENLSAEDEALVEQIFNASHAGRGVK